MEMFYHTRKQQILNSLIMSAYIYAIIPYKSYFIFDTKEPYPCVWGFVPPELKGIDSEFTEADGLELFADFLMINTCQRLSAFTNNKDGYNRMRADICKIATALGAKEVWYAEELATDEMDGWDFSFDEWVNGLKNENKKYVAELTVDVLKGNKIYSYYHDDFSDIIMENH